MRTCARVLIALIALLGGGFLFKVTLFSGTPEDAPATTTAILFAARLPDADGQLQSISQWRGKPIVLNFWASWCAPCREEMPELSALQEKYRAHGLVVLGISTDDAGKMQQFVREIPVAYPLLAGDFEAMNLAESLGNSKGVLPYTVMLRRDGSIAVSYFGRLDVQELDSTLALILSASH